MGNILKFVCLHGALLLFTACAGGDMEPTGMEDPVTVSFLGITSPVQNLTLLVFDAGGMLRDLQTVSPGELEDNTLTLKGLREGMTYFAAVNTAGKYELLPAAPTPGKVKASDIYFRLTGENGAEHGTESPALCGCTGITASHTDMKLEPMTGVSVSLQSWIVTNITPEFGK